MIDKELIKKEIKRRINLLKNGEADLEVMKRVEGVLLAYNSILEFIDSLPEEPASEDLGEELDNFLKDPVFGKLINRNAGLALARHFAEWGGNHFKDKIGMVSEDLMKESNGSPREGLWNAEKVTEWLENHVREYKHYDSDFADGNIDVDDLVEDLRKAMED